MITTSGTGKCNPTRKKITIPAGATSIVDSIPASFTNMADYSLSFEDLTTNQVKSTKLSTSWDDTKACETEYAKIGEGIPLTSISTQLTANNFELSVENRGTNPVCVLLTRTI